MSQASQTAVNEPPTTTTFTETIKLRLRTPARFRNLELALLVLACGIVAGAVALVQLGALDALDPQVLSLAGGLGLLVLIFHIVLRITAPNADPFLLPIATVLNGLGIAMIYRLDLARNDQGWGAASVRQMVWTALAITVAVLVVAFLRNHRVLARYRFIAMFVAIALLLLPMLPGIGREVNGARVWIGLGPFSFQPGEIAKIALAVFFAGYLVSARDSLALVGKKFLFLQFPRVRDLGPIIVIWLVAMVVLVFQRDLGTSLLYFGLFLCMIYVATGRESWVILGVGLFVVGGLVASQTLSYVEGRFNAWLDPFRPEFYEQQGGSYQLVQGLFGMAHGGLIGTGLGEGRPNLVPLAESDYIVASLGEELGLAGLFAILALYLLFVSRGFRIGFAGGDDFGKLLGVGLAFVVAFQIFIVIGGVTRVIPLTGLTTPFLAAGGSSLVANWIIVALLLRLSDTIRSGPKLVVGP
ncbi:FtsW/RodA/SpoVE family cell cycle protein [Herbiconiux sp. SYSU D00978]|uniref:FtsW/RodA/SpoVE family cell cycle protein n=1 Tax=Herbiconiux sp. SYSU D00978 TaxID=2812562 RepID=UPI001A95D907|nr:FtsW/RodA/SpoVE family cell cycle protein [Herbiconiux sp. SYSU D00978]